MQQLSDKKQKTIILLITELDHGAKEGSEYFAKQLAQLYNHQQSVRNSNVTTMISSDEGTNRLIFKDTSPFRACKPIELVELNETETYEWLKEPPHNLTKKQCTAIYKQTEGYPGLIHELIEFAKKKKRLKLSSPELIPKFINNITNKNNIIQCKLVKHWFRQITDPRIVEAIAKLNQGEQVSKYDVAANESAISTFGFFRINGENVAFRNPLVAQIIKNYVTPLNVADHYWVFSAKYPEYWEKGKQLYLDTNQITLKERLRDINQVIGPNDCSLGEFIHTCCRYFDLQKDESSVFSVLTDILQCLFDVKHYRLLKINREDTYITIHEPKDSKFVEQEDILQTLIQKSKETKRAWVSAWDYSYMAYPVPKTNDDYYLLVINNQSKEHWLKKEYNWSITALSTKVGLTLSQLKKIKDLEVLQSVFKHADDDIRIFDSHGNLKSANTTAIKNTNRFEVGQHSIIKPQLIKQFLNPNITLKALSASEVWQNKNPNDTTAHMEVSALKYESIKKENGCMISITRDVTLQREMLARVMTLADAKSEKEVYDQLLKGLIEQRAKRVRVYVPEKDDIASNSAHVHTTSKYCAGYDNQPQIKKKFEGGEYSSKGIEATLEELNWGHNTKPTLCRFGIDVDQITPIDDSDNAFKILKIPKHLDGYRSELDKEDTVEWLHIGLSAENKMFAMLSIDKGNNGEPFKSIEYNRMATICKAAETALARIHSLDLINLVRMFRHSIAQQLTAIGQYMWIVSEGQVSSEERLLYAETVDELIQKFELFNRNTAQLIQNKNENSNLKLEQVALEPILEQTQTLFKYQAKRCEIELIIENVPLDANEIHTHNVLLHTIIFNLVANSFAALEHSAVKNKKVIIRTGINNNKVVLSIIDNGNGIKPKDIDSIFKMGFSTKQSSGIGLPTCLLMANTIGANLSLDKNYNNANKGCKFDIITPIT